MACLDWRDTEEIKQRQKDEGYAEKMDSGKNKEIPRKRGAPKLRASTE